jgi:hypothetical protein
MASYSEFRKGRIFLGDTSDRLGAPGFARATISLTGAHSAVGDAGSMDIMMIHRDGANPDLRGAFKAERVWNAVWNDVADFQKLDDRLEYGRCYYDTLTGAKICSERCQQSVVGIASDTFGFGVGAGNPLNGGKEVPLAVAGWTLAYVDAEYSPGTVLTNDEKGNLTKMGFFEKLFYPERIVALYKRKESELEFGVEKKKIKVNGRHWVKVK